MSNISRYLGFQSLVFITLMLVTITSVYAQPKGSVCIIKSESKLVMVDEILTGKWSLPAGTISEGERPELAAQREAWEETGLVVTVGKELGRNEKAIYYDCVSDSDLIAYSQQDKAGGHILPIWFAPHYGIEVSQARLIEPLSLSPADYRYPEQWSFVNELYNLATDQPTSYVESLIEAAPRFNQVELPWIAEFQASLQDLPSILAELIQSVLLTGLVFTSSWWLLLLSVCYAQFGRNFTLKLIFTLIFGAAIVQVGQLGFQLPRPYVYQPSLNLANQVGFSLPNLSVTLWTISLTMIINRLGFNGWNRVSMVSVAVLLWLVTSLFYSASAFLIDSFAGLLLGWLCAWHMSRLKIKIGQQSHELFNKMGVWILLTCVSIVLLVLWQTPAMLELVLLCVCLLLIVLFIDLPSELSLKDGVFLSAILALVMMIFAGLHSYVDSSNWHSLILTASQLPVLLLICAISLLIQKKRSS